MRNKVLLIVGLVLLLQSLWVPATLAAPPLPPEPAPQPGPPGPGYGYAPDGGGGGFWHMVSWGDTLSGIAWRYGVNAYAICSANGLANCNYIYAGQQLWIPAGGGGHDGGHHDGGHHDGGWDGDGCGCRAYHQVTWGQTLSGIASWYGTTAWGVAQANGIHNLNQVYAGQTLCIP
jgi:hypothetical protein